MFSSTTNPFSPFIIDHHEINSDIFLQQNQPTIPLLPVIETSTSYLSLLTNTQQQQQQQVANCVIVPEKKKKDRHSKIYTAQGLRDRRVRLSIEIARRFFHLQDMLGFDKASKTLEWLLTKSKKAIKEVEQNGRSPASTFQKEALALSSKENGEQVDDVKEKVAEDVDQGGTSINSSSTSTYSSHKKNTKKVQKCVVAKESRAKARARARERTRIKISKKFNHSSFTQILMNEYSTPNLIEQPNFDPTSVPKENNIVEESIVIEKKLKQYPTMGYQQNIVMLKDLACNSNNNNNNNNNLLPNLLQNWEINSAIARSSFCAITNMNRSTGLHLCGKLWEAENSSHHCLL